MRIDLQHQMTLIRWFLSEIKGKSIIRNRMSSKDVKQLVQNHENQTLKTRIKAIPESPIFAVFLLTNKFRTQGTSITIYQDAKNMGTVPNEREKL